MERSLGKTSSATNHTQRNPYSAGRQGGSAPGAEMTSAPGPRIPRTGGTQVLVEVLTSYLSLADQVTALRTALAKLAGSDAPADEPDLGRS